MKEHFCPAEQSMIAFEKECNWCGEKEALAQTQEPVPPPWWTAVENILNEYGLQAIDFVADFNQALAQEQEPVRVPWSQALESVWAEKDKEENTPPQHTEQLKACVYCSQFVGKEKNTGFTSWHRCRPLNVL